ncbi:MAG: hypothetical protein R3C25_00400 [Hyphomonadaceae bacterium]
MSDISLHFTWLEWIALVLIAGWPGLLIGGALGALALRRRRIAGAVIGAIAGCLAAGWIALTR